MQKIEMEQDNKKYSLRGKVFEQLEEAILNGQLQPGDNLIETKLSQQFGVSRTPIREAIRQLELEGLVQLIPNKGAVVLGVTTQDIEDIYSIRMLIEGLAVRWTIDKITQEEIEELQESVELLEFYIHKKNPQHLEKFDSKFHDLIYNACKSRPLKHMLSMFHHYIQGSRASSLAIPGRAEEVLKEHKGILDAIIECDSEKAEKLMYQHIRNASQKLITQRAE